LTLDFTDDTWKAFASLPALPFLDSEDLPFFVIVFKVHSPFLAKLK